MIIRPDGQMIWRWWNTLDHLTAVPRTLTEQAELFRELFFDSCRLRLRSDVPVATCLSGGVDSSAVLCTLAAVNTSLGGHVAATRRMERSQRAFVATFPGTLLDERPYAEAAIRHAAAEPHYREMSADVALDELDQVIYDFEEIITTLPTPIWAIYRELRRDGVVVSLDGHGADELLGGYPHYIKRALRAAGSLLWAPLRTLDLVNILHDLYVLDDSVPIPNRILLAVTSDPVLRFAARNVRAVYRRMLQAPYQPHYRNRSSLSPPGTEPWVTSSPVEEVHTDPVEEAAIGALGPFNAHLYRDFHRTVLPTILRNFDRCSMAHGIEVRMPFMDWRLVSFVFSLPEESKIGGGFTKRIVREAMRGVMPESLRTRKSKIGFNSPLPNWFNGPLRRWIQEQINSYDFLQSELWNGPAIRSFVQERQQLGSWAWDDCERVWLILHAHAWRQSFFRRREGR